MARVERGEERQTSEKLEAEREREREREEGWQKKRVESKDRAKGESETNGWLAGRVRCLRRKRQSGRSCVAPLS